MPIMSHNLINETSENEKLQSSKTTRFELIKFTELFQITFK
jgi:hypothetical protein